MAVRSHQQQLTPVSSLFLSKPTKSSFAELAGFDPNDPKGEKAAAKEKEAAAKKAAAKKKKAATADLDDLLNAGLSKGKKK